MTVDRNGLDVLDRDQCLQLLGVGALGRVALSMGALPTILPVSYRLIDDQVVFRTGVGSKLDAATRGAVIAFEVDAFDPETHSGWSVVVTGIASDTPASDRVAPVVVATIPRWAPEGASRVLVLSTDVISGRRISPVPDHRPQSHPPLSSRGPSQVRLPEVGAAADRPPRPGVTRR